MHSQKIINHDHLDCSDVKESGPTVCLPKLLNWSVVNSDDLVPNISVASIESTKLR